MKTEFLIVLNVRTADGFVRFGQFDLGTDREAVGALYETLAGVEPEWGEGFLHMDLVEMRNGLPVSLRVLSCTAEELKGNVGVLVRQVFRWKNLDEAMPGD